MKVSANSDTPLTPGQYDVALSAYGERFKTTCSIAATADNSRCEPIETDPEHLVSIDVRHNRKILREGDDEKFADLPAYQIHASVYGMEDDEEAGWQKAPLPREVSLEIVHEGVVLLSETIRPEIRRLDGSDDPDCGLCETSIPIELELIQP